MELNYNLVIGALSIVLFIFILYALRHRKNRTNFDNYLKNNYKNFSDQRLTKN